MSNSSRHLITESPHRAKAIIFNDSKSRDLLAHVERLALAEAPVLIHGETGTGKELLARRLHALSTRQGPFVAVNCGALTQSLADSELFGHQAGSFTGANETRAGWFEASNGGTLFLDEIGDLAAPLQVKLLRVLQEREVVRVGSRKSIPLDFRLVAATNVDLGRAAAEGRFRLDLYYRLNVATLHIPPLRERREDILPLAEHFLRDYGERLRLRQPTLTDAAKTVLRGHSWPGNIRELENVIHFALLVAGEDPVGPQHLRFTTLPQNADAPSLTPLESIAASLDSLFAAPSANLYESLEALIVRRALEFCRGNQVHTAKMLSISRNVLRTLLKRYGLLDARSER